MSRSATIMLKALCYVVVVLAVLAMVVTGALSIAFGIAISPYTVTRGEIRKWRASFAKVARQLEESEVQS